MTVTVKITMHSKACVKYFFIRWLELLFYYYYYYYTRFIMHVRSFRM